MRSAKKTRVEIEGRIAEIENDCRYKSGQVRPATIVENAPLALIQLEMETRLEVLKQWLASLEEADPFLPPEDEDEDEDEEVTEADRFNELQEVRSEQS